MSRVKEWGSIQSVGKQSAPLSSGLFFGHWTLEQTKAKEFWRSQKEKPPDFFRNHSYFCGNNQALCILYWLHSWLFGLTNISSHFLPSHPFLENTHPLLFPLFKTFPNFSMAAVFSVILFIIGMVYILCLGVCVLWGGVGLGQWECRRGLEFELYNIEWIVYVCGDCLFLQTVRSTSFINSFKSFYFVHSLFLHKKINHSWNWQVVYYLFTCIMYLYC